MMKLLHKILLMLVVSLPLVACNDDVESNYDPFKNFDALWTALDEHYTFSPTRTLTGTRWASAIVPR